MIDAFPYEKDLYPLRVEVVVMKFLSLMAVSLFSAASICTQADGVTVSQMNLHHSIVAKGHHRGPRGHRGHTTVAPAYIETIEVEHPEAPFVLAQNAIIPLGNTPSGVRPLFLEYVDSDPTSPTADRYIHVLRGGSGKYLIVWSISAVVRVRPSKERMMKLANRYSLVARLEIGNSAGIYDTTRAADDYFLFADLSNEEIRSLRSTGTHSDVITLQEGDRVHLRVLRTPGDMAMVLASLPNSSRCVEVTMTRIAHHSQSHVHR
jgi:hypothetical protein